MNSDDRIAFYDFDMTLVKTPTPEAGRRIWLEKKGSPWPHRGWWSKRESLDVDVFDFEPVVEVVGRLEADQAAGALTVLLTNRLPSLGGSVRRVLDSLGVRLDEYTFLTPSKASRVRSFADANPHVRVIDVYDDDERHLRDVAGLDGTIAAQLRLFAVVSGRVEPF